MQEAAESGDHHEEGGRINSAHYKCQVFDVVPSKIYRSEVETKNGQEYFINSAGTFSHVFSDLLIKKSPHSLSEPEFDRLELTPPADGILSLLL